MSGETQKDESGWTVDTLGQHIRDLMEAESRRVDERFADQKDATITALAAAKEATTKAEVSATERLEAHNGVQEQSARDRATFVPRNEIESRFDQIERIYAEG